MYKKLYLTLLSVVLFSAASMAQVGQGALKGKVTDKANGEPVPFANLVLFSNGNKVTGGTTDFDGNYTIKPIPPGKYELQISYVGYQPMKVPGIVVNSDKISFYDAKLTSAAIDMKEFEVVEYSVPLISKDGGASGESVSREDIAVMPTRGVTAVAQTVPGVTSKDDGSGDLNVRGSRSDANYYYIDGIKVRASTSLPQSAIEQVTVITGGLPAQYGDVTGGVISITTRGASRQYFGGIEYNTSGVKLGDKVYGLDPYGYNLLEFSLSGPILFKKDTAGKKTDPLVGFFLTGNLTNVADQRPSAIGNWKIKDDVLAEMSENPLRYNTSGQGTFQNLEFIRLKDLENVKTRMNDAKVGVVLQGKLDFNVGKNANFTVGGNVDYSNRHDNIYSYSMFNWENNPEITELTYRGFARFVQRFNNDQTEDEEQKSAATVKNAYYSIQVDYEHFQERQWDDTHKDNYFNYGYVGKFKTYQEASYNVGTDSISGQVGLVQETFTDTLIGFTPDTSINPLLANYTSKYYELYGWKGYDTTGAPVYDPELADDPTSSTSNNEYLRNLVNVRTFGGLVNGDKPRDIYSLYRNPGWQYDNYYLREQNQYRVSALGSADIGNHAVILGFEYEQRIDRLYSLNPVALWTAGRQYVNSHITNLDRSNPYVEAYGNFDRFTYTRLNASPDEVNGYNDYHAGDAQYFFDYNLRTALGLDPDGTDFIDFDSYDPETFKLNYFSADELFRSGNELISYYGYDPYGNKYKGNPSIDDFFTAEDDYGNKTRPIGAFKPIYMSGFLEDKFAFKDLIFRIGLRLDRFDANQSVLKDPFVLFPTLDAGTDAAKALVENGEHPDNVEDDYVVYVDNVKTPTKILGYRNGNVWYNAEGAELPDAEKLRTSNGLPAPLLANTAQVNGQDITSESFVDYKPQNNFLPRIAFSFPISEEAAFTAHYDVLTKRPTDGLRLDPLEYYFIQSKTDPINNPNLKPEKTIDYEVGFQQVVSKSSSIKISAFYREMRDLVQLQYISDAYPKSYSTYTNIDFGTVKGTTIQYDLRRTGNLRLRVGYTLSFAEGTGSSSTSGLSLVRAGLSSLRTNNPLSYDQRHQVNGSLDYRYASGGDYNGPIVGNTQILANTGLNIVFNGGSGFPYNKQSNVTNRASLSPTNGSLDGKVNGSRLPWQFRFDARLDRDIPLTFGAQEAAEGVEAKEGKTIDLNIYIQVLNVLNTLNIVEVYRYTGNPDDDGYLTAPQFQKDIIQQNSKDTYQELYSLKVNDYNNYSLPRRIRLGIMLNF